jgi:hypothetical protein
MFFITAFSFPAMAGGSLLVKSSLPSPASHPSFPNSRPLHLRSHLDQLKLCC